MIWFAQKAESSFFLENAACFREFWKNKTEVNNELLNLRLIFVGEKESKYFLPVGDCENSEGVEKIFETFFILFTTE